MPQTPTSPPTPSRRRGLVPAALLVLAAVPASASTTGSSVLPQFVTVLTNVLSELQGPIGTLALLIAVGLAGLAYALTRNQGSGGTVVRSLLLIVVFTLGVAQVLSALGLNAAQV